MDYLWRTKNDPKSFNSVNDAKSKCSNPNDARLDKYADAIEALYRVWGTDNDYRPIPKKRPVPKGWGMYGKHANTWRGLTVTDLPTNTPGQYNLVEGFANVDVLKGTVIKWTSRRTRCRKEAVQDYPHYWLKMGKMASQAMRSEDQSGRYVRCFSCAAIAAYTLVTDTDFNNLDIAVVGAATYDHYFVVVGDLERIKSNNWSEAKAIDLWAGNMGNKFIYRLRGFRYAKHGLKYFCEFPTDQREDHARIGTSA
jgi:hypothetical protein